MLPNLLCAKVVDFRQMRTQLNKLVRAHGLTPRLIDALEEQTVSSNQVPGRFVIESRDQCDLGPEIHFWCDILTVCLLKSVEFNSPKLGEFCYELFERPWGGLCFLSQESNGFGRVHENYRRGLCQWIVSFGDQLDVGPRFHRGCASSLLWEKGTGLSSAMGSFGATSQDFANIRSMAEYQELAKKLLDNRK